MAALKLITLIRTHLCNACGCHCPPLFPVEMATLLVALIHTSICDVHCCHCPTAFSTERAALN
eukprot:9306682-Karenia_brevis.AAC.1